MNRWLKKSGVLALILGMTVSLSACGTGNSQASGGKSASSPATASAAATTAAKAGNNKKIVIGFSMATLREARWQKDREYFVQAAQQLGAEVKVQAAELDDAKQISQAENLISQGVNVLVVVPNNADAAAAIVKEAHKAGIKVLSYDRLINNSDVDLYVSFDNERVGQLQAQAITKLVPKGNYALIEGADTDNNAHLFKKGQMDVLQPLIDKGDIKVVYDQWTKDWDPSNALKNMENALTANNNKINAVLAANDGTAGGVVQALTEVGLQGKVPVSGQDADLAGCQRIVAGTQSMTVYKPIKLEASTAAKLAVQMAKGETVDTTKTVNNGKIDVPSVLLTPVAVIKDNMDSTVIADGFHTKAEVYKNAK